LFILGWLSEHLKEVVFFHGSLFILGWLSEHLTWKNTSSFRCSDNHPRINKLPWKNTTSLRCSDNHSRINKLPWKNTTSLRCSDNHPRINLFWDDCLNTLKKLYFFMVVCLF
jgi:hypothetical protein